jgi:hypothetical protein
VANQPQYLYVSQTDLEEVMSVDGVTGAADDDADGSIYPSNAANTTGEQRFILRACIWGTNRVNLYCAARYKQSVLATSFSCVLDELSPRQPSARKLRCDLQGDAC